MVAPNSSIPSVYGVLPSSTPAVEAKVVPGELTNPKGKSSTPSSSGEEPKKNSFGLDLGMQTSFLLKEPYQMPVLGLSARLAYSHRFGDRFTLRTSAGLEFIGGSSPHEYTEDLGAPAPEAMEEGVEYPFSREHETRKRVGGFLGGVVSPVAAVSAQIFLVGQTSWTPHVTLGVNRVFFMDTVTNVSATHTPDSDTDNGPYDYTHTYTEEKPVERQAAGMTFGVVPVSVKIKGGKGGVEVGGGFEIFSNPILGPARVVPMVEVSGQFDFPKHKK